MSKKAIALIRVSTEQQAGSDRASIPAQTEVCQQIARRFSLDIAETVTMTDVSGTAVLAAPEMQRLMRQMERPEIHAVVCREFSRLMRPERGADYALIDWFRDTNTVLYLPDGPHDFSSASGQLMGTIHAAIAGYERREILSRIWTAKEQKRKAGELAQSTQVLPFGVSYTDGRWHYKPEAEMVREAFRRFLAGEQNYSRLATLVGVTPRGMHLIMRNPIWTGWRVIDKKRDLSAAGKYHTANGRQGDRRKVARGPEDIIRVRVIEEPLISEQDFRKAQEIMDAKQRNHWRATPDRRPLFTYAGFLHCADCGSLVHTSKCRRHYYRCAGRYRDHNGCRSQYMERERLEGKLDGLFADRLTDDGFLSEMHAEWENRNSQSQDAQEVSRLQAHLANLQQSRERTVSSYIEGLIDRDDRDRRLVEIERNSATCREGLMRLAPPQQFGPERLAEVFSVFTEWRFLAVEDKRKLLAAVTPDIRVADYEVSELGLNAALMGFSNENTRVPADTTMTAHAIVTARRP